MSKSNRKLTGILTIVFAGVMGLTFSAALASKAPTKPVSKDASAVVTKKIDRDWVWKKKAVNFDGMYRTR